MNGKIPSVRRNAAWMLAGTGVYAGCQWVIAVALARLGGAEVVGLFAFASALSMPCVVASQLALRQILVTDVRQRYAFADYFRLRAITTVVAFFVIASLGLTLGYRGESLIVIVAIGAGRCFESISDIYYGRMQSEDRLDWVAQFTMLRGALCVVAVVGTYASIESIGVTAIMFAAACAVSTMTIDNSSRQALSATEIKRRGRWSARYRTSLFAISLPLTSSQFFNNLNGNMPRLVLQGIGGSAMVGQYAVVEHFIAAASLGAQAVGQAAAPRLARLFSKGDEHGFCQLVLRLLIVFVATGLAASLFASFAGAALIRSIYGSGFEVAEQAFSWLMLAATIGLASSVLGYAVTATRQFEGLVFNYGLAAATTLVLSVLLAPAYGLIGIAIAIAGGQTMSSISTLHTLHSRLHKTPR